MIAAGRVLLTAVLTAILLDRPLIPQNNPYQPDDVQEVSKYGCEMTLYTDPAYKGKWWHLHIWADYLDGHRWIRLYAVRPEKEHVKALNDCGKWMTVMHKLVRGNKETSPR